MEARPFRRRHARGPAAGRPRGWHFFAFVPDPLHALLRGGLYGADRFDARVRPRFAAVPGFRPLAWRPAAAGVRLSVRVGAAGPAPGRGRWRDGVFPPPYARRLCDGAAWGFGVPDRGRSFTDEFLQRRASEDELAAAPDPD